ncbi:MAG: NADPH:quinone oxidoreductase family protein, partial [Pseudomonadales bacterium]
EGVTGGFDGAGSSSRTDPVRVEVRPAPNLQGKWRCWGSVAGSGWGAFKCGGSWVKAVQCTRYGGPEELEVVDLPEPGAPGAGQVQVALEARGIQFSDLVRMKGEYQVQSPLPFVVGGEGAGKITAVGSGVSELAVGDLVLCPGGCVETLNVSAKAVTALPQTADPIIAASFRNNYATAYDGLQRARLAPGESLLVHGSAGGVGLAAVDLGKLLGATVIGTASSDEKLAVVTTMGADHVINYGNGFREPVKALTGGLGADVIYDPVGGDVFDESMRCIAPFGRILVVGFTSGRAAQAKTNHLLVKDAAVIGYTVGGLQKYAPERNARNSAVLLDWLGSGRIKPHVSHVLPMARIHEAYQLIVDRKVVGKIMISNE